MDNSQRKHDRWFERYCIRRNTSFEEYQKIINKNNSMLENINKGVADISKRTYNEAIQVLSFSIKTGQELLSEDNLFDECEFAKAYLNRGVAYEYLGKHEEALEDKKESIKILERLNNQGELDDGSILETARENLRITEFNMKPIAAIQESNFKKNKTKAILSIRNKNTVAEDKRIIEKSETNSIGIEEKVDFSDAIKQAANYTLNGLNAFQNGEHTAIDYFNEAIKLMENIIQQGDEPDYDVLAKAYTGRGLARFLSDELEDAKSDLSYGIKIWERIESENMYVDDTMLNYARTILTTIFNTTHHQTDVSALNNINKEDLDLSAFVTSRMALGVSYDQRGEFEKANEYYTECIKLFEELGTASDVSVKNNIALAYMNRASNHYSLGNISIAFPDYNRAINILLELKINNELQDDFNLFMAYKNRSQAYEAEYDMVSAADDIISALRILKGIFGSLSEYQEHYYEVLEELIKLIDFENDNVKKQNVLNEFLHSMLQAPKMQAAAIAQNRLLKKLENNMNMNMNSPYGSFNKTFKAINELARSMCPSYQKKENDEDEDEV